MKFETIAIHGGYSPEPTTKSVAVPIYQTTSYSFDDTQHGADLFDLKVAGNIYTRNTLAGDFPIINKHMVNDLMDIGEWNPDLKDLMIAGNGSIQPVSYTHLTLPTIYSV